MLLILIDAHSPHGFELLLHSRKAIAHLPQGFDWSREGVRGL